MPSLTMPTSSQQRKLDNCCSWLRRNGAGKIADRLRTESMKLGLENILNLVILESGVRQIKAECGKTMHAKSIDILNAKQILEGKMTPSSRQELVDELEHSARLQADMASIQQGDSPIDDEALKQAFQNVLGPGRTK